MNSKEQKRFSFLYSGLSDIGLIRQENQDSFAKLPENNSGPDNGKGHLFIVADGVGGHVGGKQASSMSVQIISNHFNSASVVDKQLLKKALEDANSQIYNKAANSVELNRMATTTSALFLKDDYGIIAHVGDSRVYGITNNRIEQLTKDHTQVQELLSQGVLKKEDIDKYPNKSVLVRAMGAEPHVKIDFYDVELNDKQSFVLCSDGLGKVNEEEILNIVLANSPEMACKKLVTLANDRGGKDNVTVLVIKLTTDNNPVNIKKKKSPFLLIAIPVAIIILLAAFLLKEQIFPGEINSNVVKDGSTKLKPAAEVPSTVSTGNPRIDEADKLFEKGKIENALTIYKKVLQSEPMDLRAIRGMNKIADYYFQKAERLRKANDISGAVKLYYKVNEIQPDHEMSSYYIELYKNRVTPSK